MALARISLPAKAAKNEVVAVRVVIQHPMETGFRVEADGRSVPKNVVHRIVCSHAGREVWRAELGSGISANPYFEFFVRAEASGEVMLEWEDDRGERGVARARLEVV